MVGSFLQGLRIKLILNYGTTGHLENCQVDVPLAYSTTQGHTLIDRRLYLPESWADDPQKLNGNGCRWIGQW